MALVLIVDSNPDLRALFVEIVEECGHRVHTAHNEKETLASIRRELPALLLIDPIMPFTDGSILHQIRLLPFAHHIRIVVLSSVLPSKASMIHTDAFIRKPFHLTAIEEILRTIPLDKP